MSQTKHTYRLALVLITSLFFLWGFIHNLDPILIAHLRNAFSLSTLAASLVDSAVFIAYFVMAIPAGLWLQRFGYKSGILLGLLLFAVGCFLFVPAANSLSYPFFLLALFVLACGLTILETAANPYITVLGPPAEATQRLNFAQSFNGLAAFVAPIVGGQFILSDDPLSAETLAAMSATAREAYIQGEVDAVKGPFILFGLILLVVAFIFFKTKLPLLHGANQTDGAAAQHSSFREALRYSRVRWAVGAQFFYVGAQVCVLSMLVLYATDVAGIAPSAAKYYAALAGAAFMAGRFIGTFIMKFVAPAPLLAIYASVAALLTLVVILGTGIYTLYAMIAIAFFMSIMFPTIFAFGVQDIGSTAPSASSLIIMSIVGGALIPPIFGYIADQTGHLAYGYSVVLLCFAVVLLFAIQHLRGTFSQESSR